MKTRLGSLGPSCAAGALLLAGSATAPLAAQSSALPIEVRLNGERIGFARIDEDRGGRLLIRVDDLRRAVDGGADAGPSRLEVQGRRLVATAFAPCPGCSIAVRRSVVVSTELTSKRGILYMPLDDLVRAVEGRLARGPEAHTVVIHVGQCSWCILEPRAR